MACSGIVKSVSGEVTATDVNGNVRVLQVGDRVSANETISTGNAAGTAVSIAFPDRTVQVTDDSVVALNDRIVSAQPDAIETVEAEPGQDTQQAEQDDVAQIQEALLNGGDFDPTTLLPATAAGPANAGDATGGNVGRSPVLVQYIGSSVTPGNGFDSAGKGNTAESPTQQNQEAPSTQFTPVPVLFNNPTVEQQAPAPTSETPAPAPAPETPAPAPAPAPETPASVPDVPAPAPTGDTPPLEQPAPLPVTISINTTDTTENIEDGVVTFNIELTNAPQGTTSVTVKVDGEQDTRTVQLDAGKGEFTVNTHGADVYINPTTVTATVIGINGVGFLATIDTPPSATAHIADVIDTTTVNLSASTVDEGEGVSYVFTATLSNASQGETTIMTDKGNIFIADGETSGTLVIASDNGEDVYKDSSELAAKITGTSSSFENLTVNTEIATAQIIDSTDTTEVSLTADPSFTEDGVTLTYTVALGDDVRSGDAPVVVNFTDLLGNAQSITIESGHNTGTAVVDLSKSQYENLYQASANLPVATDVSASGGNFEALGIPSVGTVLAAGTEDTAYTVSAADLLQGFSDVDGNSLSVSNLSADHGAVTANPDGSYTITPAANYNGPVSLSYSVIDGQGGSIAANQSYTLAAVNDGPAGAGAAVLAQGTEDTAYTVSAADLLQGFSDVDGNSLSVSNLSADHGTVTANPNGSYTVTPDANYNGPVSLSYSVIDGQGGSIAANQSFSLAAVNDAPAGAAAAVLAAGSEDSAYTVSAADLLQGFSDVDRDSLSVSNLSADHGTVTANPDGSYTITPAANYNGPVSLSYNVIDGQGGSIAANQSFSLAAVNDAPAGAATASLIAGTEDTRYTVSAADLLQGFSDVDRDSLSVSNLSADHGTVTANPDGSYTVTPAANYNGPVSLSYNVIDGQGGSIAANQSFSLAAVNDAPAGAATASLIAGTEDTRYTVSAADLLQGFSDVDRDSLSVSNLSSDHGTVTANPDGSYTVTPAANYNGPISLSYSVIDGQGGSIAANQSFSLAAVNDAPAGAATASLIAGSEDSAYTVSAADLLQGFSDIDGDSLSVSNLSADHGTVTANPDGSYTVTPAANYNGPVSLSYNVIDGQGGSIAANQSFSLAAVNDEEHHDEEHDEEHDEDRNEEHDEDHEDESSGADNHILNGGDGNDTLNGGNGNDTLNGGNGKDTLNGGDGNDTLNGGADNDTINGGDGVDLISFVDATDGITFTLDQSTGVHSTGALAGGLGTDTYSNMEGVIGSNFNDTLTGSSSNDTLVGGSGNDTLNGGAGKDSLFGGSGNDILNGGAGKDILVGGGESDIFKFSHSGGDNADTITDFHVGNTASDSNADVLNLHDLLVGTSVEGSSDASVIGKFVMATESGNDTVISIHADGKSGSEGVPVVTLQNVQTDMNTLLTDHQIVT
ncbi:MAG TPA: retention module-containing protein [Methylobacter sp.]